ncbi:iron-sulfur protein [Kocuria polaris]|nr:iron-sulfur protein [Kocuria polaris]
MAYIESLLSKLEQWKDLDRFSGPLAAKVESAVSPKCVRNLLSGKTLGHPLHPALVAVPIGAWGTAAVLDVCGYDDAADAAVATGLLGAVPTAAAGLHDWSFTMGAERRVGLVHAAANSAATLLYVGSLVSRRTGRRGLGRCLSLAGFGLVSAAGFLGGHLSYAQGVGVNRAGWREPAEQWADVGHLDDYDDGAPTVVEVDGEPVMVLRDGDEILALHNTCTHLGGPLAEGELHDGCVVCPWHGSEFDLRTGAVRAGPASVRQPRYEAEVSDGHVRLRAA